MQAAVAEGLSRKYSSVLEGLAMALKPPDAALWMATLLTIILTGIQYASDRQTVHDENCRQFGKQACEMTGYSWSQTPGELQEIAGAVLPAELTFGLHLMGPMKVDQYDSYIGIQWHGTTSSPSDDETSDGYDMDYACLQSYALRTWQVLTPFRLVSYARRYRKRTIKPYDPADTAGMSGHCLYACIFRSLTGQAPGLKAIRWVRRRMTAEWSASQAAGRIADAIGMTTQQYASTYLKGRGWGGLPELMVYTHAVRKQIRIVDPAGHHLMCVGKEDHPAETWTYDGSHYTLVKRVRTNVVWTFQAGEGYDAFQESMRDGGKQAPHKYKQGKSRERRHGWDTDIALPGDARPPLPRRKRNRSPLQRHQQRAEPDPCADEAEPAEDMQQATQEISAQRHKDGGS